MSMEKVLQQLHDAAAVTAAIQERHARMIVDHDEWLVEQTKAIARHERWLAEQTQAIARHEEWLAAHEARVAQEEVWRAGHEAWRIEHEAAMQRIEGLLEAFLRGRGSNGGGG
jgi:hypothetical protein